MIPVTVVGGYLGAGKTTLINGLLAGGHGRRLAVLVNDFGAINIDAKLIVAHDGDTIALSNGCVCCTIADALGDALDKVLALDEPPDQIVIEASGVANPAKIAMYGQGWPGLSLDGVIVVADGETVQKRAVDKFVGTTVRQQLVSADLLILNKVDLLSDAQCGATNIWLRQQAPGSRIVSSRFGDLPAAVLLGQHTDGGPPLFDTDHHDDQHDNHHEDYRAVPFRTSRPMDRDRLQAQIATWPDSVLRAKGSIYLRDDCRHAYILQLGGRRHTLERGPEWGRDQKESQLILIGASGQIDPAWLRGSLLAACV